MKPRGFLCPHCRKRLYVITVHRPCAARVDRYRECANGHRFKTEERIVEMRRKKSKPKKLLPR